MGQAQCIASAFQLSYGERLAGGITYFARISAMHLRRLIITVMAAWAVLFGTPAAAQDITPSVKSASSTGIFVWTDGAYHSIKLPAYGLGFFETSTTTFEKLRAVQTYNPRATGEGVTARLELPIDSEGKSI